MSKTHLFSALAVCVAAPAVAQDQNDGEQDRAEIVVTGKSLEETGRALEECLARGCPPEEDIRLTLEHAENQFLSGEYRDSGKTLRKSIGRNKKYDEELPLPVSDLHRAYARVSEHEGEAKDFQLATLDMRDILEDGLGEDHWRTLVAEIAVGDSRAKLGQPDDAEDIYKRVERHAVEIGQPRVAMYARMRQALLLQSRYDATKQTHWRTDMVERLEDIRDNPLPGGEEFVLMAEVMLAKLDRKDGDASSTEALIQRFAERGGVDRPVLLSSAPLYTNEDLDRESQRASSATARLSTRSRNTAQWADLGFWIDPDGRVTDLEVLRAQGDTDWLKQVARHINSRRYAPLKQDGSTPGFYMIERYTYTARFADQTTGTRMRKREPVMRIERLDITPDNYSQPVETG
mgnify:CR=1 FL=1